MSLDSLLRSFTKINLNLIIGINVRAKTIKILEVNTEVNVFELGSGKVFFGHHTKSTTGKTKAKTKLEKLNFTKIKNIGATNCTIKNVKHNPQNVGEGGNWKSYYLLAKMEKNI